MSFEESNLWVGYDTKAVLSPKAAPLEDTLDPTAFAERIRALRAKLHITQDELASRLGNVTRGAVGNWERGGGAKRDSVARIAEVTGASFEWLNMGRGEMFPPGADAPNTAPKTALAEMPPPALGPYPAVPPLPRVPIRGAAIGASATTTIDLRAPPLEYVDRPPGLATVLDAYAFYVPNDVMSPMHSRGDLRFVHPRKPPRQGDSVLVIDRLDSETQAWVCQFTAEENDWLVCKQINPPAEVRFKRDRLVACHRVLTTNEVFAK